jgi:hypothetical protein
VTKKDLLETYNPFYVVPEDRSLVFGITLIPLIFAIPILIWILYVNPPFFLHHSLTALIILLKVIFFFFFIALVSAQHSRNILLTAIKNPILITLSFLISAYYIWKGNFTVFVASEAPSMRSALPYFIAIWLLFPIIQSRWIGKYIPNWLLIVIKIPIIICIFITAIILVEIWGMGFFQWLFNVSLI